MPDVVLKQYTAQHSQCQENISNSNQHSGQFEHTRTFTQEDRDKPKNRIGHILIGENEKNKPRKKKK